MITTIVEDCSTKKSINTEMYVSWIMQIDYHNQGKKIKEITIGIHNVIVICKYSLLGKNQQIIVKFHNLFYS